MTILVTGATGSVGRRAVAGLLAEGHKVRASSRNPRTAGLPDGAEVVAGDLGRPETLPALFAGVERMYLISINGDGVLDRPEEVVAIAREAGVRRIVVLSSSGRPYHTVEGAVRDSGLEFTFVRPGEFATTKIDVWGPSIRAESVVRSAYLDVPAVPIHEADIADVVVRALVEDRHVGKTYELTAPEQVTQRAQIEAIGAALGRPIRIEELSPEQARENMLREGWPEIIADHILGYFVEWEKEPPAVSGDYAEVVGRPGRTFAQWARDHVDDFR
ncbi:NAD(P)H-binding protein [Micromonospora aurantiaca]|uniref:NAD(P)H-binding protein n=1 Tax=Micromonospora TaxID=1873 RepID=UPI001075C61B